MKKIVFKILAICITAALLFSLCGCSDNVDNDHFKTKDQVSLVKEPKLEKSSYKIGDNMGDYTLTDVNGKTYSFSEILKDKKAIVLNFWFINCGPCQMEFPYLQAAADKYSDDVVVIAINPTDDKEKNIVKYATQNELSIPLVKGEEAWNSALSIKGYPTTIVIDRYGRIAFNHMGAITQDGVFEKIFKFFADDNYEQTIINDINEIKD